MTTRYSLSLGLLALGAAAALLPGRGETRPGFDAKDAAGVQATVKDGQIEFTHGKALSGRYIFKEGVAKPYLWPLNAPSGKAITRDWPMVEAKKGEQTDHVHQKSMWFCHGDVIPEGIELKHKIKDVEGIDFWSEANGHGVIACTKVGAPMTSGNHAQVATTNEWRTADGVKVMDEARTIHFYDLGSAQLFVFDIDLNASVAPITFGDTKEGSFGVRMRDSITEKAGKGVLTNAEGHVGEGKSNNKNKEGCWGLKSAWCDYSGPSDGETVGLTIFADPNNPYPSCWHSRSYGLMAANPFGRDHSGFPDMKGNKDLVKLAKGQHLRLRYGILLHDGDVKAGKAAEHYEEFVKLGKK
jgi:hypothetical protein